jgi:hypothetical protein
MSKTNKLHNFQLVYPHEGVVCKSNCLKDGAKLCYKDFKRLNDVKEGLFTIKDLDRNKDYSFKVSNNKMYKVNNLMGGQFPEPDPKVYPRSQPDENKGKIPTATQEEPPVIAEEKPEEGIQTIPLMTEGPEKKDDEQKKESGCPLVSVSKSVSEPPVEDQRDLPPCLRRPIPEATEGVFVVMAPMRRRQQNLCTIL